MYLHENSFVGHVITFHSALQSTDKSIYAVLLVRYMFYNSHMKNMNFTENNIPEFHVLRNILFSKKAQMSITNIMTEVGFLQKVFFTKLQQVFSHSTWNRHRSNGCNVIFLDS